MAIREITVDGKLAVKVDTEEEFARVFDRGLPIRVPREVIAAFGVPGADEKGEPIELDGPSAEVFDLADEDTAKGYCQAAPADLGGSA